MKFIKEAYRRLDWNTIVEVKVLFSLYLIKSHSMNT
jgi:hypothetical protein